MVNLISHLMIGPLIALVANTTLGQQRIVTKPVECKSTPRVRGKFRKLFVGSSGPPSLEVDIEVQPRYQSDDNYRIIANQLKAEYCEESKISVLVYDNPKHWNLGRIRQPERPIEGTPRALYFIDRKAPKELFEVYSIVNGKVETRSLKIGH